MGCNCGKNRRVGMSTTVTTRTVDPVVAGSKVWYEVWRNGTYTGRRSDSLMSAQAIAERLGGEVRTTDT